MVAFFFFFNDTATTEIYTLPTRRSSDLPRQPGVQSLRHPVDEQVGDREFAEVPAGKGFVLLDRKSTRLNSSHSQISYAVFCLKKKTTVLPMRELTVICTL